MTPPLTIGSGSRVVAVTGAGGFIGSYLVKSLLKQGVPANRILAVDESETFRTRRCAESFEKLGVLVMSPQDFAQELSTGGSFKPEIVFHMGACSSTDEFREDYLREVNLGYSRKVWQACSRHQIPLLYASSAATYGDGSHGFSDDPETIHKLRPLNPYGWSKQYFDLFVLEEMAKNKECPPFWAGFKFFNVYGPGEDHKGKQASVLFHARKQMMEKGQVRLFKSHRAGIADGEQKRDFVWIGDVTDVLLKFSTGTLQNGIYNLGSGQARTFIDLARAVAASLSQQLKVEWIETPEHLRPGYQYFTEADVSRLREAGYTQNFTSLEAGARQYVEEWSL
jgi:ADP-L-glycero-D-manno-heptose 6-epimerase